MLRRQNGELTTYIIAEHFQLRSSSYASLPPSAVQGRGRVQGLQTLKGQTHEKTEVDCHEDTLRANVTWRDFRKRLRVQSSKGLLMPRTILDPWQTPAKSSPTASNLKLAELQGVGFED